MYPKIFNFGSTFTGLVVEAQVLDTSFAPLTSYSTANVTESGSGQYAASFALPTGFSGYVRARVQSQPAVIDTYEVNIPAPAVSLTVASNSPTVLLVTGT